MRRIEIMILQSQWPALEERFCDRHLARYRYSVARWCLTFCNPVDCRLPVSSVHGILQARILEWVAISSSRGSSQPRDRTCVSCVSYWQVDSLPLSHLGSSGKVSGWPRSSFELFHTNLWKNPNKFWPTQYLTHVISLNPPKKPPEEGNILIFQMMIERQELNSGFLDVQAQILFLN